MAIPRYAVVHRTVKTYLQHTVGQQKLNDLMLLHIRKQRVDYIDLKSVIWLFVDANEDRSLGIGLYRRPIRFQLELCT